MEQKEQGEHSLYIMEPWFLDVHLPRACWIISLVHSIMRKGRLFCSQRKRQRSSDKEALGSPDSGSESGGSISDSDWDWCRGRWWPCECECAWLWEFILDLLDEAPPLDSAGPLGMGTRTSVPSGLAAGEHRVGVLVTISGCTNSFRSLGPVAASRSLLGCITAAESFGFEALPVSLLKKKKRGRLHGRAQAKQMLIMSSIVEDPTTCHNSQLCNVYLQ